MLTTEPTTDLDSQVSPPTAELQRWRIRVTGVVQGVGFRPYIYRLAIRHCVNGWVLNDPLGVLIEAEAENSVLQSFLVAIRADPPLLACITDVRLEEATVVSCPEYEAFNILKSIVAGDRTTIVPSDSHVCEDCLREMRDTSDRRYRYPFINCTNCGPRYSLIRNIPYDRQQTTMAAFTMCDACRSEYENPGDRRYHAQPNACPECGPKVSLAGRNGLQCDGDEAVRKTVEALRTGLIVGIKSVGGFHLAVNARDDSAVKLLRQRKRRDAKPFALMVASREVAELFVDCHPHEAKWLESPGRPIVLLKKKAAVLPEEIAPRNPNFGVMIASAPLHYLLLNEGGLDVLVMTSGNISGYPIAYRNETALSDLFDVADLILYNDRDIETRVDDSVLRCSIHPSITEPLVTFIRRGRGFAPYALEAVTGTCSPIIAYGAELKTTVALSDGNRIFVSQHIGDLKNDQTFASHRACATHLSKLFGINPHWVVCDLHPDFRATRFASIASTECIIQVQHHHAHMAACMVENRVLGATIGVIFDGAGFGDDGTIWGGEFLLGDYSSVRRVAHLRAIPLLGGDKAVHQPIRVAAALALDAFHDDESALTSTQALAALDDEERRVFGIMWKRGINSPLATSMGRLFDGIAALLGICSQAEYEAQGPIELEALLGRDMTMSNSYAMVVDVDSEIWTVDHRPLIRAIVTDMAAGVPVRDISRRFHSTIVRLVTDICQRLRARDGVQQVVMSGGVFLNEFLLVNCQVELRKAGFAVHSHQRVPCNDGCISLGQVAVANAQLSQLMSTN